MAMRVTSTPTKEADSEKLMNTHKQEPYPFWETLAAVAGGTFLGILFAGYVILKLLGIPV